MGITLTHQKTKTIKLKRDHAVPVWDWLGHALHDKLEGPLYLLQQRQIGPDASYCPRGIGSEP